MNTNFIPYNQYQQEINELNKKLTFVNEEKIILVTNLKESINILIKENELLQKQLLEKGQKSANELQNQIEYLKNQIQNQNQNNQTDHQEKFQLESQIKTQEEQILHLIKIIRNFQSASQNGSLTVTNQSSSSFESSKTDTNNDISIISKLENNPNPNTIKAQPITINPNPKPIPISEIFDSQYSHNLPNDPFITKSNHSTSFITTLFHLFFPFWSNQSYQYKPPTII